MSDTPNLDVNHWEPGQSQPEVTVNDAFDAFDRILTEQFGPAAPGTLTLAVALRRQFFLFNASGTATFPSNKRWYLMKTTAPTVTVQVSGGGSTTLTDTTWHMLYYDGAAWVEILTSAGISTIAAADDTNITSPIDGQILRWQTADWVNEDAPYDLGYFTRGPFASSQLILRVPVPRSVTFPSALTGSRGVLDVAPAGTTNFDIRRANADGTSEASVGTMQFTIGSKQATFSMASQTTFASGQILIVKAPITPDASAQTLGFMLRGKRD